MVQESVCTKLKVSIVFSFGQEVAHRFTNTQPTNKHIYEQIKDYTLRLREVDFDTYIWPYNNRYFSRVSMR